MGAVAHLGERIPCKDEVASSILVSSTKINLWECSVTRTSVELYDMGERNGGRPAGEGTKTPCSTLEKFKMLCGEPTVCANGRSIT